jgi:hypothetical protein
MIDPDKVLQVVEAFDREGVEYKLFGGVAVNFHGVARGTEDADFFVDPSPENVRRIKRALRSLWDDPNIDQIQDDDMIGDYPSVSYTPPNADYWFDIVSRLGEAYAYADLPMEIIDVKGVQVRIVTPQTLYEMKKDTVRYKDKLDAMTLRQMYHLKG